MIKFLTSFAVGFLTTFTANAMCSGVNVDLHLGSYHTAKDAGYANNNYGLGATCVRNGYSISAGAYHNSFARTSGYVTANMETTGTVRFGGAVGFVFGGYDEPVKPIAGVSVSTDFLGVTGRVVVGPTIEKRGAVFHFVVSKTIY